MGVGEHANTGEGDPLPAGEYEVWAVMTFIGDGLTPTRSDRVGTYVAGGPEPFTMFSPRRWVRKRELTTGCETSRGTTRQADAWGRRRPSAPRGLRRPERPGRRRVSRR